MKLAIKWLEKHGACEEAVREFQTYTGNTDSIFILKLLIRKDKLYWGNWLCTRLMSHKQQIQYAIYAAEQVLKIFEKIYPNDTRPRKAIEAAKAVLKHNTKENRAAAHAAAYAAAYAADAAYAAYAAYAAADAAYAAYAAYAAADAADAAYAADALAYAARAAAYAAHALAYAEMRIKIIEYGIKLLENNK